MLKKDYPDEGELVVGTIVKVQNYGAFVSLDEYPGREGFIHIAEVATGWVKRIRNHIKEKQKVVCKVVNIDKTKNHIDLSLKRVNEHQKRDKIQEWKNSQKAERLIGMVADRLGKSVEDCFSIFGNDLIKKYGTLYGAFEEFAYDEEAVRNDGISGPWFDHFEAVAKENISIPFVEISGYISIRCWLPDGIKHIIDALKKAEVSEYEDVSIKVKYIGAPNYMITVKAPDYKVAEDELKKSLDKITLYMKQNNGQCEFHRKAEE
jgi:translation initiation factor 2 subunit 1